MHDALVTQPFSSFIGSDAGRVSHWRASNREECDSLAIIKTLDTMRGGPVALWQRGVILLGDLHGANLD